LPDKAIDLLDEAGSRKRIDYGSKPPELLETSRKIDELNQEKVELVNAQDYERAAAIRDEVRNLKIRMDQVKDQWMASYRKERKIVEEIDIQAVLSDITGIPVSRLAQTETDRLLKIEEELHKGIIGQESAIGAIASAIRRSRTGLSSPKRPLGSFIFLGPTGVGKSLLAKTLAKFLFGNEEALIRIDMSDYMEKHNVSRLVGAPPGYVGYEEGGMLTEKIRRRPYSVVLLDEIEKAHSDVFNLLLQVLEEGELQDNLGHRVSFRNTVVIMTSNAGAREITKEASVGFHSTDGLLSINEIKASAMNEIKRIFRPEFLNRIDDIIVFESLSRDQIGQILEMMIEDMRAQIQQTGRDLKFTKKAQEFIIEKSWDVKYGARPLRRTLLKEVEDPLSLEMLKGRFEADHEIVIDCKDDKLTFRPGRRKIRGQSLPAVEISST
jgi:ATP-dependent Clp protease ATP-binding subunit ClpC